MDQEALVDSGKRLIQALEDSGTKVRGAMWVRLHEIDSWRLWIVSSKDTDKKEFYRAVAGAIPSVEAKHPEFSISDVELKPDTDPVIKALALLIRSEGIGSISLSRNMVNGVYTPDGIMLRMAL